MPILPATCLFIRPPVTRAIIWRSRGVNNANLARASEFDFSSARRFRSRSSAPVTASSISCSRTGLVRKSIAPAFMALTDIGTSPCPVIKMIGILMPKRLSSACRSKPLNRGSLMSKTRQARDGRERMLQQLGCGCERLDAQPDGTKQAAQPAEHERIIVDNEYDWLFSG